LTFEKWQNILSEGAISAFDSGIFGFLEAYLWVFFHKFQHQGLLYMGGKALGKGRYKQRVYPWLSASRTHSLW
jgi:hypothetical protein